jgi:hypothetical protein
MKAEDFGLPADEPIDIGHGGTITLYDFEGEIIGLTEGHKDQQDNPCFGFVSFKGARWADGNEGKWTIVQAKPLTLSPSILCTTCGRHGYIRDGKWVEA